VEGDLELLAELIELYLIHSPAMLAEIDSAVAAKDGEKITRAAHTLKGMLKNMCAERCADAALELESAGRVNDVVRLDQSLTTLREELEHLRKVLIEVASEVVA
jgi:HPt (histidine-containing phosphotransfer) domain-containing protein